MLGLTIYQPHATLVALGAKENETRPYSTTHRGELLITAARRWDEDLATFLISEHAICEAFTFARHRWPTSMLDSPEFAPAFPGLLPLGAAIAVVDLVDCFPTYMIDERKIRPNERAFGNYGHGRFVWKLANVRPLRYALPIQGQQRLWTVDDRTEKAIRATMAASR